MAYQIDWALRNQLLTRYSLFLSLSLSLSLFFFLGGGGGYIFCRLLCIHPVPYSVPMSIMQRGMNQWEYVYVMEGCILCE